MGKKGKALSQEEIWDDSALIQSWDDALDEYKLYHSIHARGERVEDVLLAAQGEEQLMTTDCSLLVDGVTARPNHRPGDESLIDGELEGTEAVMSNSLQPDIEDQEIPSTKPHIPIRPPETNIPELAQNLSSIPQGVVAASTQDEAQKNLMMSWYWAGYYTGFHEGQKQASG
ncbi:hypothetical protein MMC34_002024 [Xylographa carneopallida]|nr:hypothetical protein [Xylographa carneopallida]